MYNGGAIQAITYYNKLIESDIDRADREYDLLQLRQREEHVLFGDRPLSTSLRPSFLTERAYGQIQDSVYLIRQAVLDIARYFFNQQEVINELGLTQDEIDLAAIQTNVIRLSATARFDAFMTGDSFKFVEINAESPAGVAYCTKMASIYHELEIFQKFIKKFPVRFVSPLEHLAHGLLRVYHEEFGGNENKPSFAIVDFQDVPTVHEFKLIKYYFELFDIPCEICDPRDVECKDGWAYVNGRKIDIIYRRILTNEFLEVKDECNGFMQAYIAQKTCYLNSFRSKLVHKKSIFSLLTDPKYSKVLNHLQLEAIKAHIPWTRKLTYRFTPYRGHIIDLVEMVRKNKNQFVIKPNDEYGGKGVTIGIDATDSEWDEAIDTGLSDGYVVQEMVNIHREPFMLRAGKDWKMIPTVVDLDPYINGPLVGGCLTRTSSTNLANVTSGGGSLPMFILRYL